MLHAWYYVVAYLSMKNSWNGGIVDYAITSLTNKRLNNLLQCAILKILLVLQSSLTLHSLFLKLIIILKALFRTGSIFFKMVLF